MKKIAFVLLVVLGLSFYFSTPAVAGGGYLEVTAKNRGVAGKTAVEVDIYSYSQAYGTGSKTGKSGDNFSVRVENAPNGTACTPESVVTDSSGHANFTCTSQTPGTFQIHPHLQMSATGLWVKITSKGSQLHFDSETGGRTPSIASPPTVVTNTTDTDKLHEKVDALENELAKTQEEAQKSQEAMMNEIEALQNESRNQQNQISALRTYIENIFDKISLFFSFLKPK